MRRGRRIAVGGFVTLFSIIISSCNNPKDTSDDPSFVKAELEWREARDQSMKIPTSWLTIAGLYWLDEEENGFGTDPQNRFRLPEGSGPPFAGKFILHKDKVKVLSSAGTVLKNEGKTIKEMVLKSDKTGKPDIIELNDLRMWVIERGGRLAIRLSDLNAPRYKNYSGLEFFPPQKKYQVKADFVVYNPPKMETLGTVVGTETKMVSLGYVKFRLNGKEYRLDAFETRPGSKTLFIIFKDETSGKETYGTSRFMEAHILDDGSVDLNFNRAHNPPCAYTPYATCPLPPSQNILPVKIEAGEKIYKKEH
jgi:uncharacterized protein (DUF1684 family)